MYLNVFFMLDKYLIILPEVEGSVVEEWRQCLEQLKYSGTEGYTLVKLNVFVDSKDFAGYIDLKEKLGDTIINSFNKICPAFNITVHPPERPWKVSAEAGFIKNGKMNLESKIKDSVRYVVGMSESSKALWAGGFGATLYPEDTHSAGEAAFEQMRSLLESEEMSFDNIVRQWNYLGEITGCSDKGENYHLFNQVRSRQYGQYRKMMGFPAATGIGMKFGGVNLDFFAIKPKDNYSIVAVNNPDQVRPYEYGRVVLRGVQAPQFERALLVADSTEYTLFISGTASILGQDTIGIDDVERQTVITIENIMKLVDASQHFLPEGSPLCDINCLILLRVYVKRQSDFEKVKNICKSYFIGAPAIYIEADVCRDNLLVEIEAEFFNKS